jgi:O-antigen/teichoic acid export membrane protein
VLNLLLIPAYGALGAAIATLASLVLVLAVALVVTRRWMVLPWPLLDTLKVAGVCAVSAPFIAVAARATELLEALALCAAAGGLLLALLLATNAASSRTMAMEMLGGLRRRHGGAMVTSP